MIMVHTLLNNESPEVIRYFRHLEYLTTLWEKDREKYRPVLIRGGAAMCQFGRCHCRHTGRIFQHTIRDPLFRIEKVHPGAKQRDHTARRFAHNHPPVLSGPMPAFCSELV